MKIHKIFNKSMECKKYREKLHKNRSCRSKYKIEISLVPNKRYITVRTDDERDTMTWRFTTSPMYKASRKYTTYYSFGVAKSLEYREKKDVPNDWNCYCSLERMAEVMNAIISHLLYIFPQKKVVDCLKIHFAGRPSKFRVDQAILSIKRSNTIQLWYAPYNRDLELILKKIKVKKGFYNDSNDFCAVPCLLRCRFVIDCQNATAMTRETLLNLDCRVIFLGRTRFTTDDVMEFFKKWKNSTGNEMKYIRYIEMVVPFGVEVDLGKIGGRPWDRNKRNRFFESYLVEKYLDRGRFFSYDFENAMDLESSDGRLASVIMDDQTIRFVVWPLR